jgi:hypothetical protein
MIQKRPALMRKGVVATLGGSSWRSADGLWGKLRKALVMVAAFAAGELLGFVLFTRWLQIYDFRLALTWPITLQDLLVLYQFGVSFIIVPIFVAQLGGRLFGACFPGKNDG